MLALSVNYARTDDGQLSLVLIGILPLLMDFLGDKLADAVGRIGSRKRFLCFQLFRRAVRGDGAGEKNLMDIVLFRKGNYIWFR